MYKATPRRVLTTTVSKKAIILYIVSVCVCVCVCVGIGMQCARAILSSVACPALQYSISTLSPTRHDFRRKVTEDQMRVLCFSTTFVYNISHS
jgi:hypothetical protein